MVTQEVSTERMNLKAEWANSTNMSSEARQSLRRSGFYSTYSMAETSTCPSPAFIPTFCGGFSVVITTGSCILHTSCTNSLCRAYGVEMGQELLCHAISECLFQVGMVCQNRVCFTL